MHISESALSRQLSLLEEELGLTLFLRSKQRLIPTEEGLLFREEAERAMRSMGQLSVIADEIGKGQHRKRLRVLSTHRVASTIAVPAVAAYTKRFPGALVDLEVQQLRFLERWIASYQFDIGITALPTERKDVVSETICSSPIVVVMPSGHHLAKRETLCLQDLENERFILPPQNSVINKELRAMFA
ncbi:MAG: LysR substrate-binding domain-containing protein, partial [Betaproteobacteria bacterium]